ncbi:hypothetical protein TNIN_80921 [Trichonephila inaurata madagascariensis]|uniref:Uncharacterized protein n=1 Tax=Trichonephila inaurata madagascariensis TaxID=2747483 RepID=A0A8X7BYX5_9ARAC|nr:hypothetical protein TNIN_80921 [Trichonephila inaurata madagascariensis]
MPTRTTCTKSWRQHSSPTLYRGTVSYLYPSPSPSPSKWEETPSLPSPPMTAALRTFHSEAIIITASSHLATTKTEDFGNQSSYTFHSGSGLHPITRLSKTFAEK